MIVVRQTFATCSTTLSSHKRSQRAASLLTHERRRVCFWATSCTCCSQLSARPIRWLSMVALTPLQPADLWVPKPYESFVSSILTAASWPRTLRTATPTAEAPSTSTITTEFDADNKLAIADVHLVGRDLVDAISATLDDMRRTGAEFIAIRLPACQPATATHGAGLTELGVSFAAYLPEFRPPTAEDRGDVVVAQWLADPVVDPSDWSFTTPEVEQLVTAIVEQAAEVGTRTGRRQRRAAQRASLLAALD